jgi:hypothetical protein
VAAQKRILDKRASIRTSSVDIHYDHNHGIAPIEPSRKPCVFRAMLVAVGLKQRRAASVAGFPLWWMQKHNDNYDHYDHYSDNHNKHHYIDNHDYDTGPMFVRAMQVTMRASDHHDDRARWNHRDDHNYLASFLAADFAV